MGLKLGDVVPDFEAETSQGPIKFHEYIGDSWAVLFSHPADFTPVCTTELGAAANLYPEFEKRGFKVLALSCQDVESHKGWIADIESAKWANGAKVKFPIVADPTREIALKWGMIDPEELNAAGIAMTARAVFVIKDKKVKLAILYPATTGRNFDELLRAIDSLMLTASHSVATPVNWNKGQSCMVVPAISDEAAKEKFGSFDVVPVPSGKRYIRTTADPVNKPAPATSGPAGKAGKKKFLGLF